MKENTDQQERVRVLVVDDQRLMRDGIASLLSIQEGIDVVGTAGNGQEAIEQAQHLRPDVILMDVRMPVLDGVAATLQIRRHLPTCQVLMLTTFDDDEYISDALRAGACGYLLKDIPAPHLAKAIRAAHEGIYQFDPTVASKVISSLTQRSTPPAPLATEAQEKTIVLPAPELTTREIDVLRLIAQGATNREIAARLVISEGTVKNHISNILSRLGLRDRTQAAIYAREHGLL
jgi:DNA-binding NarL/FixJ family response regulator